MRAGRPANRVAPRYVERCDPVTKQSFLWDLMNPKMDPTRPDVIRPAPADAGFVEPTVPEIQTGAKPGIDLDLPEGWLDFTFEPPPCDWSFGEGDFSM
jgi:hypothetical protein